MLFIQKIWQQSVFEKLSRFIIRHAFILFLLVVALTAVSLKFSLKLRIDSDYMAFLPESFPGVKNLKKVIQKTGGFGNFMIVLEGATPEARRQFAETIAREAEKLEWVDYAEYKKEWEKIEKNKLLYLSIQDLELLHERIARTISLKKNPMYISLLDERDKEASSLDLSDIERRYQSTTFGTNYFEDPKLLYTITVIWPKGSMTHIDFVKKAYGDLDSLIQKIGPQQFDPNLKVIIGGEFRSKIDEYSSLLHNVRDSFLITFVGICILLFLFFRRKRAIFFVLAPLVVGVIWTTGLAYFLVGRLNLLSVFLVAILLGLGMDYGIYFFSRYMEERIKGHSMERSLTTVLLDTGRATLSSASATAVAFISLTFTDFKGFQEFGLLASIGVVMIFISFMFFSPVLWILGEKLKMATMTRLKDPPAIITKVPLSRYVIWIGFMMAAIGLFSLPFISFEYDYGKLRSRKNTYWEVKNIIHQVFPLSKTPAAIITDTLEEAGAVVRAVNQRITQVQTIDTVKSILDLLPDRIEQKKRILSEIEKLVLENKKYISEAEQEKLNRYLPYFHPNYVEMNELPRGLVRQFTGLTGSPGYLVFIYDKVRLSDAKNAMSYADDIREIKTSKRTYYPAEGSLLFADALRLMIKESHVAFWLMLIGVYGILLLDFRNYRKAFVVILPLCLSLFATLGILFVLNIKINIFNLIIFPILIGIGMDSTVHLYHRFQDGFRQNSLKTVIRATCNPLLLATLTNMLGFGSTLYSDHLGLNSIGIVALIGLATQLAASFLFFPAFLKWRMDQAKY